MLLTAWRLAKNRTRYFRFCPLYADQQNINDLFSLHDLLACRDWYMRWMVHVHFRKVEYVTLSIIWLLYIAGLL